MKELRRALLRELQGRLLAGALSGALCFLYLLTTGSSLGECFLYSLAAALAFACMA
ncbi:MAG TPA: hypothetical protein VK689_09780 [Armatimonadota bacterium]|nr:hypothetical protein [Armatimonadota bacterium]